MSSSSDTLQFRFPTFGNSILSKMNALREEQRFCDITLLLGGQRGTTVHAVYFHGHRVVLAASSDFLRDQFLLHEGRSELTVGAVSSVEVGERLLLSCYTGLLEVPLRELVSYLTAASALQMSQVVNKCVQAVSQYFSPTLGFLDLERTSEKKEIHQLDSLEKQEESNAAHLSTSIQTAVTEKEGGIQLKSRVSQRVKEDSQELREVKDDTKLSIANIEIEGGEMQSFHANKPSYQDTYITSALEGQLCPPTPTEGHMSSPVRGISSRHEKSVGNLQNKYEKAEGEQRDDEGMFLLAAQRQECEEPTDSDLYSRAHLPKSHSSGDELTEDLDSTLVQRPYLCRRCDRVFQQLESYAGHLKEHRQYFCLVCGKSFSQKSSLTHHIGVHSGFKPFRCPLCHEMFSQKAMLQDHLNLHTGNKPHKCNYCAVHFAHKPGLRRHLKDIHGKSSLQNMLEEAVD